MQKILREAKISLTEAGADKLTDSELEGVISKAFKDFAQGKKNEKE